MPLREQSAPQFGMAAVRMRSLRTKLLLVIFAAVTLAQILAAGLSLRQEAARYAEQKSEALIATVQVLAAASAQATANEDVATA